MASKSPRLDDLVEASAHRTPGAVALADARREITYRELLGLADSIAAVIASSSGGRIVGVLIERGIWTTVAALAALRAGRAYMPIDPALPQARMETMTSAVDCDCLLIDAVPGRGDWFGGELVVAEAAATIGRVRPPLQGDEDGLAYVIFTSGSTGEPKAVGIEQGPATAFVRGTARRLALTAGDRILQLHSTSFDSSIEEIWPTLAVGAQLGVPSGSILDVERIVAQAASRRVTVLHMVTSYWRAFVQEMLDGLPADGLDSLRHLETGGEEMRLEDLEAWRACELSSVPLSNGYGPTEGVVTATAFPVASDTALPAGARSVPIGWALEGRCLYIRDEEGREVPPGEVGELYIGGEQLARGYLNDSELTAKRFLPDGRGRMYKTGDLVRELTGGALEFVGRADGQVKVRGFRVELGEVESAFRELPGVADAAVVLLDRKSGRLGAVVAVADVTGDANSPEKMRAELEARLPTYMVPPLIEPVAELPRSASGKLDRAAVRDRLGATSR